MAKIPPEVLIAPPEYLHPEMVKAFQKVGFGAIPIWTNTGCALFVHIDRKTIKDCRNAVHLAKVELYKIDGCPLIRMDIKVYDRPDAPLHMDCFLDITDKHSTSVIEALTEQEWLVFHWYDENLTYVRSSGIRWPVEQREEMKNIIAKAKEIIERTGGGDFNRAQAKFIATHPI